MRVLIVNTSDIGGGAARAAYRLHRALLADGVDSQMLVQSKSSDDYTVVASVSKVEKVKSRLRPTLDAIPVKRYKERTRTLFSPSWLPFSGMVDKINAINADVVHLHWINAGMIKIEDLAKLNAPIIWSLHDMWAFTGGCHYDESCGAYKNSCGECVVLGSKSRKDLSAKVFSRKKYTYSKIKGMTVVGLSRWMQKSAEDSTLFKDMKIVNLPNPIDTDVFQAFDKVKARELWGLPQNKKLVLFGAMGATSDPRKGFTELSDAFKNLKRDDVQFVVFGASKPLNAPDVGCIANYVGRLSDDISLVTLYSAVDVMIVPSKQENLSNAIMESLACGTPVVGFNIGGNSDLIEHKINGYLAEPFDTLDLARGIEWVIDNDNYDALSFKARDKVMREFDSKIVANKYIELYSEILSG